MTRQVDVKAVFSSPWSDPGAAYVPDRQFGTTQLAYIRTYAFTPTDDSTKIQQTGIRLQVSAPPVTKTPHALTR